MNLLQDVITYVRRIIKSVSDAEVSDNLIIDYINRFYLMDVDARIQLFDMKSTYRFQTVPGVDQYNMPLYDIQTQPGNQNINFYPVYQGFLGPAYVNGVQVPFMTQKKSFFGAYPNIVQQLNPVAVGDGTTGPYTFTIPIIGQNANVPANPPFQGLLRGHVDITGIIATNNNIDPPLADTNTASTLIPQIPVTSIQPGVYLTTEDSTGASVVVSDSGIFLSGNVNYGLLMNPGNAPNGNTELIGGYDVNRNTINYFSGVCNVNFPVAIPPGVNINAQCYYFQTGLPRMMLFYNNCIVLRSPPDQQYLVEVEGYLSPAAFLSTSQAVPFAYMAEYLARGAARKMMSDTGDSEQFMFYEQFFKEQEMLVWKRSQRQFTSTRTQTIYSQGLDSNGTGYITNFGGNT